MQEARPVLDDLDPRAQQLVVHRLRGPVLQSVLDPTLQQQADAHTAGGGRLQRQAHPAPRKEIGVGDQHLAPCAADGAQVLVLDGAPEPEVVAQHQHRDERALGAHRLDRHHRTQQSLTRLAPQQARGLVDDRQFPPQPLHREADVGHQGTAHPDREVEARRVQNAVVGVVQVVQQIDAADEGHRAVDQRELAVQSAQALAVQRKALPLGPEHLHAYAAVLEQRRQAAKRWGAEPIDHQVHPQAATGGIGERLGHRTPAGIVREDVGL